IPSVSCVVEVLMPSRTPPAVKRTVATLCLLCAFLGPTLAWAMPAVPREAPARALRQTVGEPLVLPSLPFEGETDGDSTFSDVNQAGQIVGSSETAARYDTRAALWENGEAIALPLLAGDPMDPDSRSGANAINQQ